MTTKVNNNMADILVSGTVQATTTGSSKTFTGIPSTAKRITVMLNGVSCAASAAITLQLGDAGGLEATGYRGANTLLSNAGAVEVSNHSTSFTIGSTADAASIVSGSVVLTLEDAATFTWALQGVLAREGSASIAICAGAKSLSATLTQLAIATSSTFDAGSVNIIYE